MSENAKPVAPEHILQFFEHSHLPPHLAMVSKPFSDLAHAIVSGDNVTEAGNVTMGPPLPRNPERTVALRKLLEAKDAAVRAVQAERTSAARAAAECSLADIAQGKPGCV